MPYTYERNRKAAKDPVLDLLNLTSTAKDALMDLDEKFIGTPNYMGIAFFWSTEYKWWLRDASPKQRREVHKAFLKHHLELDGESTDHTTLLHMYLGK